MKSLKTNIYLLSNNSRSYYDKNIIQKINNQIKENKQLKDNIEELIYQLNHIFYSS